MKNLKKYYIVGFFILLGLRARSQELLNLNKSQVKAYMATKSGILRVDKIGQDGISPGPFNILIYLFPEPIAEKVGISIMTFYLIHDKCYKYLINYEDGKFLTGLKNKFNNPDLGLKRSGEDLKWINSSKKYEIEILKVKQINGEGKPVETTAFLLDIYNEK